MTRAEATLRRATAADLPAIMGLLRDDDLGRRREGADESAYAAAFAEIEQDSNNDLWLIDIAGEVAGCAQLTIIPGLGRGATRRAQIEAVRVAASRRGQGLGRWFMGELVRLAQERGCTLVQLTSDRSRADAHRFYEGLGFAASHVGYKLKMG